MPFSTKEKEIINFGIKNGKSPQEVQQAVARYRSGTPTSTAPTVAAPGATPATPAAPTAPATPAEPGYLSRVIDKVGTDINNRVDKYGAIDARTDTGALEKGVQKFGQGAGMAANALETVVTEIPGVKQAVGAVGAGINWLANSNYSPIKHLGDLIGESKVLQRVTHLYDTDQNFKDTVDGVANIARLGGDVDAAVNTANYVANVTNKVLGKLNPHPTVEVGGRNITLDDLHNSNEVQNFIKKLSPEEQLTVSKFDQVQSSKLALDNAIKAKAPAEDISMLKSMYEKEAGITSAPTPAPNPAGAGVKAVLEKGKGASNVVKDIVPTFDRIVNSEVTKALDLTQGDVKNISLSTGNEVGEFMAKNNLIGNNLGETTKLVDNFYKTNYDAVRAEIGKVKATYPVAEVPRFVEALTEIKKQIQDVAGLQDANTEIDTLLKKKTVTLADVQRAKELMDEHFQLYKATGDVKEGVAKSGLTNIRGDLKTFIEDQVKEGTGADIKAMNNNVQTSRSITDAVETRSTRGLTRANITAGDLATFFAGTAVGSPLGGLGAVILKKIYQSPSFKLTVARYLDGLSDAKKLKLKQDLNAGVVPPELEKLAEAPAPVATPKKAPAPKKPIRRRGR